MLIMWLMYQASCKFNKAGTVPIYNNKIVMVDSMKHSNKLVLPKGNIKKHETDVEAAVRETIEESGAKGKLKMSEIFSHNGVKYFVLDVDRLENDYEEKGKRKRHLLTFDEVRHSKMIKKGLKKIIASLEKKSTD